MISPEILRRYPFFGPLSPDQLKAVAMITEEVSFAKNTTLFDESQPAEYFYLLMEGEIDLYFRSEKESNHHQRKELLAGIIDAGDVFAISGLIEPYIYTATARAANDCCALKIDSLAMRKLMESKCEMGYALMRQIAKAAMERLGYTRVQLAAAWAD